jgi:preprotein translocase subunit SecE
VQSTTTVVLAAVFLFAAYFFVVDTIFGTSVTRLIQYLTKH